MQWKIYYDDGSTFDDSQGTPNEAPAYGVICIVQQNKDVGRTIQHRWDYFAFHENEWYGHHLDGLLLEMLHHADNIQGVIAGRTVPNDDYQKILKQANKDSDFPVKSAYITGESGMDRVK